MQVSFNHDIVPTRFVFDICFLVCALPLTGVMGTIPFSAVELSLGWWLVHDVGAYVLTRVKTLG